MTHDVTRSRGARGGRTTAREQPLAREQSVGLFLTFGGNTLVEGMRRIVNNLPPSASPRLRVNQSAPNRLPEGLTEQHWRSSVASLLQDDNIAKYARSHAAGMLSRGE
jgi:hypothetical protein